MPHKGHIVCIHKFNHHHDEITGEQGERSIWPAAQTDGLQRQAWTITGPQDRTSKAQTQTTSSTQKPQGDGQSYQPLCQGQSPTAKEAGSCVCAYVRHLEIFIKFHSFSLS